MDDSILRSSGLQILSLEQVKGIHNLLVEDFSDSEDPIEPSGIRDDGQLLDSAVSRQNVGFGNDLKYPDPVGNAATLCYGICCNHGFHNGNKRTALVALLCHLDANNLTLKEDTNEHDLYKLMMKIASHKFAPKRAKRDTSDIEVIEIKKWLKHRTRRMKKGERVVTYRELRKILKPYEIFLENPKNNSIDVMKYNEVRTGFLLKKKRVSRRIMNIPYPREGMEVSKRILKCLRDKCDLTEKYGYDSDFFYGTEISFDKFIMKYKKTLKRLAKT